MRNFALRLLINAAALWAAGHFVAGIQLSSNTLDVLLVALVFGFVNALIKPLVKLLTLPALLLTLGLFTLVINAGMLLLTAALTSSLTVFGFWPAFWGSIIISLVSWLLSGLLDDDED